MARRQRNRLRDTVGVNLRRSDARLAIGCCCWGDRGLYGHRVQRKDKLTDDKATAPGGVMVSLAGAAIFFVGFHVLLSGTEVRWKITAKIGEEVFQSIFGLLSLGGIIWLCRAYGQAEYIELWGQAQSMRWLALLVMLPAFFLVGLAFTTPNPTAVRGGAWLKESDPAKGIERITRHPFLWGGGALVGDALVL